MRVGLGLVLCTLFGTLACQRQAAEPESVRLVPQVAPEQPRRLQFAPTDGNRLLVTEVSGLVGVWDIADRRKPVLFSSICASAIDACFSQDGRSVITASIDGYIRQWGADGELQWISKGRHEGMARAVSAGENEIVTGGEDGKIRRWTLQGEPKDEPLAAHEKTVLSVDVAPSGDIVSMGTDEAVRLWKSNGSGYAPSVLYQEPNPRHVHWLPSLLRLDVHWGWDHAAVFSPRGDVIAGSLFDGALRLWNGDGTVRATIEKSHAGHHVRALNFSRNGEFIASAGFDGEVRLWGLDGAQRLAIKGAHRGPALGVAVSPDGDRIASAGIDEGLRIWSREGARLAELPRAHGDQVHDVAFSPVAPLVAVSEAGGGSQIWNFDGTPHAPALVGHKGPVPAVAFSPKGDLVATVGKDTTVRLWHTDGRPFAAPFQGHIDGVLSVAFDQRGERIISGSRNDLLRVWNLEGKQLLQLGGLRDIISDIEVSPAGDVFAASDAPGEIMLWNSDGSVRTKVFKAHDGFLHGLSFSPDGQTLASVGADAAVKLWSLDGVAQGPPLLGHAGPVNAVAYSPDGSMLVSGGADGRVFLWNPKTRESRSLLIGVPVNQVGYRGSQLWVRGNGENLFFFDDQLRLEAKMLLRRDAALVFTPDGFFSGQPQVRLAVKLYHRSGQLLSEAEVATRMSSERVLAGFGLTAPAGSR